MPVTENEIARVAVQIAAMQKNNIASFKRLKKEIPKLLKLDVHDTAQSITRPNEQMWEQLVRNIKSHSEAEGNFIFEGYLEHVPRVGYKVTTKGIKAFCS